MFTDVRFILVSWALKPSMTTSVFFIYLFFKFQFSLRKFIVIHLLISWTHSLSWHSKINTRGSCWTDRHIHLRVIYTYLLILTVPLRVVISPKMADKKDDLPLPTWPTTMVSLPTKKWQNMKFTLLRYILDLTSLLVAIWLWNTHKHKQSLTIHLYCVP